MARLYADAFAYAERLSVLDIGGAYGKYYEILKRSINGFDPLYDIVELPEKILNAADLGASPKKRFFSAVEQVAGNQYSHVVFGAMLQVVPSPEEFFRSAVRATESQFIYITRFPLVSALEHDVVSLKRQKGFGNVPYHLFAPRWLNIFEGIGSIVMRQNIPDVALSWRGRDYPYTCFLIERR